MAPPFACAFRAAQDRRKFANVHRFQRSPIAEEAISRAAQLHGVEREAGGLPPDQRAAVRTAKARPVHDDLQGWLHVQLSAISGKPYLPQAARSALTRMKPLRPYLADGGLEIDDTTAEHAMRAIAPGRGNELFVGSPQAAVPLPPPAPLSRPPSSTAPIPRPGSPTPPPASRTTKLPASMACSSENKQSDRTCVDAPSSASVILSAIGHVIRCGRVSGLEVATFHAPRACMEIGRSGPVRLPALDGGSSGMMVLPTRSLHHLPLRSSVLHTPATTPRRT